MKKSTKIGLVTLISSVCALKVIKHIKEKKNNVPLSLTQEEIIKYAEKQVYRSYFSFPAEIIAATKSNSEQFVKACYLAAGVLKEYIPEHLEATVSIPFNDDWEYDCTAIPVTAYIQFTPIHNEDDIADVDIDNEDKSFYGIYIGDGKVIMPDDDGRIQQKDFKGVCLTSSCDVKFGLIDYIIASNA